MPVTHGVASSSLVRTAKGGLKTPFFYALNLGNKHFAKMLKILFSKKTLKIFYPVSTRYWLVRLIGYIFALTFLIPD